MQQIPTFFIKRCVPSKQEVVWLKLGAALYGTGVRGPPLQGHYGLHVQAYQLPIQVIETPEVWGRNRDT